MWRWLSLKQQFKIMPSALITKRASGQEGKVVVEIKAPNLHLPSLMTVFNGFHVLTGECLHPKMVQISLISSISATI